MSDLMVPGQQMLEDNKTHKNRFYIRSESSDSLYVVSQSKTSGDWQCGCKGWIRHRKCKHLATLKPILIEAQKRQGVPVTALDIVFPNSFVPPAISAPTYSEPAPAPKPVKAEAKPVSAPAPKPVVKTEPKPVVKAGPKPVVKADEEEVSPIRKIRQVAKTQDQIDAELIVEYALEHLCATFNKGVSKDLGVSEKDLQQFVTEKLGRTLYSKQY
jgi:hypothetical protein